MFILTVISSLALAVGALLMIAPIALAEDGLPPGVPVPAWAVGKHVHFFLPPSERASVIASEEALSPQTVGPAVTEDCPGGGKLCYWGGPVQHEPQLFVIFWGAGFEEGPPATAELTDLRDFYLGLEENKGEPGEKSWQGILSQYFDNEGPGSIKAKVSVIFDKPSSPGKLKNESVEGAIRELVAAEKSKGVNPNAEAQFIVLPQPGTDYSEYPQMNKSCGFHGVDGEGYSYSVIAYAGDVGCEGGEGDLAETNGTAAHEFAESATDPSIDEAGKNYTSLIGWAQEEAGNVEVADLCEEYSAEKPKNDFWWAVKLWDDGGGNKCNLEDPPYSAPPAPTVTTGAATGIIYCGATVAGTVNPNGPDAHYYFEYGPTTSYGTKLPIPPGNNAGFGTTAVPVSVTLGSLASGTTYHYRIVASSWPGTSDGEDHTFTTPFSPPVYSSQFGGFGSKKGQLSSPQLDAIDGNGDVWVADEYNNRVQEFSGSGEFIRKLNVDFPSGVAVNKSTEDLFATGPQKGTEEYSVSNGEFIRSFGGDGEVSNPRGAAVDSTGDVWVVDSGHDRLVKYSSTGAFIAAYGSKGSGNGQFQNPIGVTIDSLNHVYVADYGNNRVEEFSDTGTYLAQFGSSGSGNGQFKGPDGVATDPRTGNIMVTDQGNSRVEVFTAGGVFVGQFGSHGAGNGQFSSPAGIAISASSDIYVVDSGNDRIEEFAPGGC